VRADDLEELGPCLDVSQHQGAHEKQQRRRRNGTIVRKNASAPAQRTVIAGQSRMTHGPHPVLAGTLGVQSSNRTPTDECRALSNERESRPVIGIYIVTKNMTVDQHTKGRERLSAAGAPESAMKLHSCFGEDGKLQVFDIWESQEAFDEFLTYLGPVMEELGIELAQPPTIMPIVDLIQQ
jgi:hypothetical protein